MQRGEHGGTRRGQGAKKIHTMHVHEIDGCRGENALDPRALRLVCRGNDVFVEGAAGAGVVTSAPAVREPSQAITIERWPRAARA